MSRLDHVLDRVAQFAQAGGERLHADRAAAVEVGDHGRIAPVHRIEAEMVDLEPRQGLVGGLCIDRRSADRMGEVAHPAQQAAGDPRSAARAPGDLARAVVLDPLAEQAGGAADDQLELLDRVEVEARRDPEAVAQRVVRRPWRFVAPIRVKRGRSMRTERAEGPSPIIRSSARSSIAG